MNNRMFFFASIFLLTWPNFSMADDLIFPRTQTEIVKALNQDNFDNTDSPDETTYTYEKGIIYKKIGGKRFRLRGIQIVEAIDILPKVGALINFDFDSFTINQGSFPLLDEFGKALKNGLPDSIMMILGHTDNKGPEEYNQKLSEKRAQSVAGYLISVHGINPNRLIINGFGEKRPIVENDSEENRFKNRRVEFIRIK